MPKPAKYNERNAHEFATALATLGRNHMLPPFEFHGVPSQGGNLITLGIRKCPDVASARRAIAGWVTARIVEAGEESPLDGSNEATRETRTGWAVSAHGVVQYGTLDTLVMLEAVVLPADA